MKFEFVFLFFHSLELMILLWVFVSIFKLGVAWIAFALGITQHMLLDILFNPTHIYTYLLSYRMLKGFKKEYLLKKT